MLVLGEKQSKSDRHTQIYIYIYIYIYTHTYTHIYVYVYICMYMYVCMYVYASMHLYVIFQILFPYRLLQKIEKSSLCCLTVLYTVVCVCESETPKLSLSPFPLATITEKSNL